MSNYPRCPTCGNLLCDKLLPFREEVQNINLLDISIDEKNKMIEDLHDKLHINNACCRMRMATTINIYPFIK